MHGVQPMAKIAPSPNEASQPPRWLTRRDAEPVADAPSDAPPSDIEPVAVASDERRPGVERPPGPLERGDPDDARPG